MLYIAKKKEGWSGLLLKFLDVIVNLFVYTSTNYDDIQERPCEKLDLSQKKLTPKRLK